MNKVKAYLFAMFVTILLLAMTLCCGDAAYLLGSIALDLNCKHRELACLLSLLFSGETILAASLSYALIKEQWRSV